MTIGHAKAKEKGMKQYEKAVAKYEDKAPITERMKATVKKARKGKEVKEIVRKTDRQPVFKRKARQLVVYQQRQKTFSRTGRTTMLSICCFPLIIA